MSENYIDPEKLRDGKILLYLKEQFLRDRTGENLTALFCCLRDSEVILPMKLEPDNKNNEKNITMQSDILKLGEESYLPVFSNYEEMPQEYANDFTAINMTFPGAVKLAETYKDLKGLVLDAFTVPMLIDYNMTDIILKLESHLPPTER